MTRGLFVGARARVVLESWAGRYEPLGNTVEIVGVTPKKIRIRAIARTQLAGRRRFLEAGATTLVPPTALRPSAVSLEFGGPAASTEDLT